jgi:hypothetical protein
MKPMLPVELKGSFSPIHILTPNTGKKNPKRAIPRGHPHGHKRTSAGHAGATEVMPYIQLPMFCEQ